MMCRWTGAVLALCLAGSMIGCERRAPRTELPPLTEQELIARSQLEPYPAPVRNAFLQNYPGATVRNVEVYNDATGRLVYQINYARDGQAGSAVYSSDGHLLASPSPRVGHPQPPAPAPQPPVGRP